MTRERAMEIAGISEHNTAVVADAILAAVAEERAEIAKEALARHEFLMPPGSGDLLDLIAWIEARGEGQ